VAKEPYCQPAIPMTDHMAVASPPKKLMGRVTTPVCISTWLTTPYSCESSHWKTSATTMDGSRYGSTNRLRTKLRPRKARFRSRAATRPHTSWSPTAPSVNTTERQKAFQSSGSSRM
jgi:hypothetical protein